MDVAASGRVVSVSRIGSQFDAGCSGKGAVGVGDIHGSALAGHVTHAENAVGGGGISDIVGRDDNHILEVAGQHLRRSHAPVGVGGVELPAVEAFVSGGIKIHKAIAHQVGHTVDKSPVGISHGVGGANQRKAVVARIEVIHTASVGGHTADVDTVFLNKTLAGTDKERIVRELNHTRYGEGDFLVVVSVRDILP